MSNPNVIWIPTSITINNIAQIWEYMSYPVLLRNTFSLSIISSIIQVAIACLVGYGFARFDFRLKKPLLFVLFLTMIIPPQVVAIPNFLMFSNFDPLGMVGLIRKITSLNIKISLMDNPAVFYLQAIFGAGIRSGILIFIFRQFFRNLPKDLEDASYVDGCGPARTFLKIMLPNAGPAIVVVMLFSLVWYFNDTYYVSMYFDNFQTVSTKLLQLSIDINRFIPDVDKTNPLAILVWLQAGAALSMMPMLLLYVFCQKVFVESIERTGLVG
ncbi:MAG: carbohydrate ABC transporter permease [Saccharofermentanales bacterium]